MSQADDTTIIHINHLALRTFQNRLRGQLVYEKVDDGYDVLVLQSIADLVTEGAEATSMSLSDFIIHHLR
jgi:hypothetical protein